jgi:mono/diheme cytochrome c family protein
VIGTRNRLRTYVLLLTLTTVIGGASTLPEAVAMEPGKLEPKLPPAAPVAAAETPAGDAGKPPGPVPSANPLTGQPEAIEAGKKLYYMWCTQCHGPRANGESRFGSYAADLRKFWRGYKEFVTIVLNGRVQRQMPPWKEVLNEQQIAQVGAFLETLAIEGANWQ